jgi:hypothetical protein
MGELEQVLPKELTDAARASGNEVVLPYVEALKAIVIATRHQIAVLGLEAFEVRKDGLSTVEMTDASSHIVFTGDWKAYVATMNAEADRWLRENRLDENHGYILTSASESEFTRLKGSR